MASSVRIKARVVNTYSVTNDIIVSLPRKSTMLARGTANQIVNVATARAPVGNIAYVDEDGNRHPGYLRSSITKVSVGLRRWRIEVGAHYGVYVEYGTRYMRAQPYFRPGVQAGRKVLKQGVKELVG